MLDSSTIAVRSYLPHPRSEDATLQGTQWSCLGRTLAVTTIGSCRWDVSVPERQTTEGHMDNYSPVSTIRWQARNYRRFELTFPVRLRYQTGADIAEIDGVSKNVSIGGLLIRSASPIPPTTAVSFVLSVHGKHAVRPVHLMGEGHV